MGHHLLSSSLFANLGNEHIWCRNCQSAEFMQCQATGGYSWCVSLSCSSCSTSWFLCKQCTGLRRSVRFNHYENWRIRRHHNQFHEQVSLERTVDNADDPHFFQGNDRNCELEIYGDRPEALFSDGFLSSYCTQPNLEDLSTTFGSSHSTNYFDAEINQGSTFGARQLVMKSQVGFVSTSLEIAPVDIERQLLLADFIYGLKKSQKIKFTKVVSAIIEPAETHDKKNATSCTLVSLPTSHALIRSIYTEGKNAVITNLPRPPVIKVLKHSYMSLRAIVAHHLAFASTVEAAAWDNTLSCKNTELLFTARGMELFHLAQQSNNFSPTIPVLFTKWSDDFEPNSQAKQNRGSGWCFSITFCLPAGCTRRSTYLLSLGEKNWDHSDVEAKFLDELQQLQGGNVQFYHGGFKRIVFCHVALLAILKDQPERRKGTFVAMGNSKYTARWGYSADTRGIYSKLPPCATCKMLLLDGDLSKLPLLNSCTECASFDYSRSSILCTPPPNDYPMDDDSRAILLHGLFCYPQRLDFEVMKIGARLAIRKVKESMWTSVQATAYLSVLGLNNVIIKKILSNTGDDESVIPSTWSEVSNFEHLVDVCMHMLGLGIARTINKVVIRSWLVNRKLLTGHLRSSNKMLNSIKQLKLEWCKVLPSGADQKLGGWVSENHFAWVRISRWLYKEVHGLSEDGPYVPPVLPVTRYTIKDCKAWLSAHGRPYKSKDKVAVLRQAVLVAQADTISPPTLIGPCGGPSALVEKVITSLSAMVTACMGPMSCAESIPTVVDCYIKLFLSAVDDMERCRPPAFVQNDPIWVSSYNFTSLLNVPDMMRLFGMPRLLWEGGDMGEGVLRHVKPLVNGLKTSWNTSCHTRYMTLLSLQQVRETYNASATMGEDEASLECDDIGNLEDLRNGADNVSQPGIQSTKRVKYKAYDFYNYPSVEVVRNAFRQNKAMGGVILEGLIVCVVIKNGSQLLQVILSDVNVDIVGMTYHKISLCNTVMEAHHRETPVETYCLLLPLKSPINNRNGFYSVICKDWRELSSDLRLSYTRGVCNVDLVTSNL